MFSELDESSAVSFSADFSAFRSFSMSKCSQISAFWTVSIFVFNSWRASSFCASYFLTFSSYICWQSRTDLPNCRTLSVWDRSVILTCSIAVWHSFRSCFICCSWVLQSVSFWENTSAPKHNSVIDSFDVLWSFFSFSETLFSIFIFRFNVLSFFCFRLSFWKNISVSLLKLS
jgi:hypothetical protein